MTFLLALIIYGVTVGAVYGLVAFGFVLIYKGTGVLNMAQGALVTAGALVCWSLAGQLGLSMFIAIPLTLVLSFLLGFVIERLFLRPLSGQPLLALIMMTIGLTSFFNGLLRLGWGRVPQYTYPEYLPEEPFNIGGVLLNQVNVWVIVIVAILLVVFVAFFRYSKMGLAMRAAADDHQVAQSMGVNSGMVWGLSWAFSCLAAACGGILLGTMIQVSFALEALGLFAIAAVIFGGIESLVGAIVGGIIIGLIEQFSEGYIGDYIPAIKTVAPFVVLLLVLMFRPHGLFGQKSIERI